MEYHILASGSKGNSTFIFDQGIGILIDCGISCKQFYYRLASLGFSKEDIDMVLLTHDHQDHKKNIHTFDREILYAGKNTIEDLDDQHILNPYEKFMCHHLSILPLSISHDATSPLAFMIQNQQESLLYMTDTGYVSQKNRDYIHNLDYYIIESNHDIAMLMKTSRPMYLKRRILSDTGHLSNEYSAHLMCEILGDKTKEITLAHLSEEANCKEVALNTYQSIFAQEHVDISRIKLQVASQKNVISGGSYENTHHQRRKDQREISLIGN